MAHLAGLNAQFMVVSIEQPNNVDIRIEHIKDIVPQARRHAPTLIKKNKWKFSIHTWLHYTTPITAHQLRWADNGNEIKSPYLDECFKWR